MALNVTTAVFGENCNTATASPSLAQWDVGQILKIEGVDLPSAYQVEFSTEYTRNAIPRIGNAAGVAIPNELLQRSAPITAYIVLHEGENDRETEYWITIHITPRTPPETITPDPEELSVIDETIAALQEGVADAEAAATSAEGSASDAADHAADAEAWAVGQRAGADVPDTDPTYHNNSKYYAGAAEAAAEEAGRHEASWESWARRAETAAGNAEGSATAAGQSKTAAEAAAQTATQKATAAGESATAAAGSAAEARQTVDGGVGAINTARDDALTAIGQAGTTQVNAVNQAGANQVTAVNQAGTTQVQAVEDKGEEVLDSIPQDYSDLVDDVADLTRQISDSTTGLDTKAPVILETASGAIASFDDGADGMPVKKLVATIEPVQDLHGYDHPWPGGSGVNLFDPSRASNNKRLDNEGGVINYSSYCVSDWIPCEPNTNYYANYVIPSSSGYAFCFYNADKHFLRNAYESGGGKTIKNSGANAAYLRATLQLSDKNTVGIVAKSNSNISYKPYANICPIEGWTAAILGNTVPAPESGITFPFEPKQAAGTPSPENPLPISGYNLTLEDETHVTVYGGTVTLNADGSADVVETYGQFVLNGNTSFAKQGSTGWYTTIHPFALTGGKNSISYCDSLTKKNSQTSTEFGITFGYSGANRIVITGSQADYSTLEELNAYFSSHPATCVSVLATPQTYHFSDVGQLQTFLSEIGYTAHLLPIKWQTEAGTVCGGTVTLNPDGSADVISTMGNIASYDGESLPGAWISSMDVYEEGATPTTGAQVVYELAEPVSYHIDDVGQLKTFLGVNNVWCDTGDITELDYCADTKLFLTARDEEITGNIAPIENGTTASKAYAQGAYFWHDTKFCKALTAIASGATFTLGTNYQETTVAAELLAAQN